MQIKKAGGKIYGANLTAQERKAMNMEIQRQLHEYDKAHMKEFDAVILYVLRQVFGFGEKRLRQFYDRFNTEVDALLQRYLMEEGDKVWLCTEMLKRDGIDIEQWQKDAGIY